MGNKPKTADVLSDEHLQKIYDAGTLGSNSARALVHSMWLICSTYFGKGNGTEIWDTCSLVWTILLAVSFWYFTQKDKTTRTGANPRDIR